LSDFENQIMAQLKDAFRAKDQVKLDTLRAMKSALKYKKVELKKEALTEEESLVVFQSLLKQRKEAADQFEKYGHADRAQKELREAEIISSFLPEPLSEPELKKLLDETIAELKASSMKDMGPVMKSFKDKVKSRAEGKLLSDLVRQKLSAS